MVKEILVSVVIPFYKGEPYIDQCVRSVLEQPYKNIEILLINDGSPSGGDVCERIERQLPQVKYFVKQNEGIGATRNYGLKKASGEYIAFLDQDDEWAQGFLDEDIVEIIQQNDITAFSHYSTNHQMTRGNRITLEPSRIIGGGLSAVKKSWIHHSAMIYKREFLAKNHIGYALTRHEDIIFLQKATYIAQSIQSIDKTMLIYRNNPASETHRKQNTEDLYVPLLKSWEELLEWHKKEHITDGSIISYAKHMMCVYAIEGLEMLYQENRSKAEKYSIAKHVFEKYLANYQFDLSSAQWQIDRVAKYFNHYDLFVNDNRIAGIKKRLGKNLNRIGFVRKIYETRKYREVLPESICVR